MNLLLALLLPCIGLSAPNLVEVPLDQVFIPASGFDDNDFVEAVVAGELPTPCHRLDRLEVVKRNTAELRLKQWARLETSGPCGDGDLPDGPVPFTSVVSLGGLAAGEYSLNYTAHAAGQARRAFLVAVAPTSQIDSHDYAAVTQIEMPDLISSCQKLKLPLQVSREADVLVLLPILEQSATGDSSPCQPIRKPFQASFTLPALSRGSYLLHVRSRDGKSQNRVFHVAGRD
jgi:hypothetical protein